MITTILAALALGFGFSLHCIGMCGPIALALPVEDETTNLRFVFGRILYNAGRILTYVLMGAVIGSIGQAISLLGWQQGLSIAAGLLILLGLLIPKRIWLRLTRFHLVSRLITRFKIAWAKRFGVGTPRSLLVIGLLNGLLPCGLVYMALAGAGATGSVYGGMLFMAIFGLGTVPAMLSVSLFGKVIDFGAKRVFRRVAPAMIGIMAILFILRGLALGIPYLSPIVQPDKDRAAHQHHGAAASSEEAAPVLPSCCTPDN